VPGFTAYGASDLGDYYFSHVYRLKIKICLSWPKAFAGQRFMGPWLYWPKASSQKIVAKNF
jgi:hypothetical protein